MLSFDETLATLERETVDVAKGAASLATSAKPLGASARIGDLVAIRRELERLRSGLQPLSRQIGQLDTTRHLSNRTEEEYLAGPYLDELVLALKGAGIEARRDAESVIAFPVIVRVMPSERMLRLPL